MEKKNLIVEEAMKRFQQITEYVIAQDSRQVLEADDEGATEDPNMMDGDPNAMGGDPNAMDGSETPEGFNPQGGMDMGGDPNAMGAEPMQPEDEVIDVDELTDAQEHTEHEVAKINSKFDKVLKAIGAFEELLRSNDEKIEGLKNEFEKRNPTKVEKLHMQTARSYPFNQTPEEYWKEKEATSNYEIIDNDDKEKGKFVITTDDVNGAENWKDISDTLDDDILFNQTLNKILGL